MNTEIDPTTNSKESDKKGLFYKKKVQQAIDYQKQPNKFPNNKRKTYHVSNQFH